MDVSNSDDYEIDDYNVNNIDKLLMKTTEKFDIESNEDLEKQKQLVEKVQKELNHYKNEEILNNKSFDGLIKFYINNINEPRFVSALILFLKSGVFIPSINLYEM